MAGESLRDLVVSLSLDSDNFTRNIKSVNAQMKEAESTFKLAGAGIKNFENSMAGTAAQLELVRSKYTLQEKAVAQFARALQAAENKLTASKSKYDGYGTALAKAGEKVREAAENAKIAEAQFRAVSAATGKNSDAAMAAKEEWEEYKRQLAEAEKEQKKIQGQLDRTAASMQKNADAVTEAKTKYGYAQAAAKELRRELELLENGAYKTGVWFENIAAEAEIAGRALERAGVFFTRYVSVPFATLGAASIKASIDFETAFVGVRKTVDATETQYRRLAGSIKEMSGEVADSAVNIASVVATAGQLGIANDHLMTFTRTVQDLTVSTEDLKGTEAAEEMAKFANVAQMSHEQVSNLGSALTYLGNNYATTEGAIMAMALNIAAAGKQVGLTEAEIVGLAAGLSSVGLEADKGGTAMSKALKQMEVAAVTGGEALDDFARISGMTADEFKAVWESDPAGAFMAFIEGLARMDDEGISAIATMQEIGMAEVRLSDTMLRTVNAHELFTGALNDSTRAWEENTALAEEANKFYATTESRLKNVGNRAKNFAARLGDDLNPQIQSLIGMAEGMLSSLEDLDAAQVRTITRIGTWAAVIGPLSLGAGKLTLAMGDATKGIGKFLKSMAEINATSKVTGKSWISVAASLTGGKAALVALGVAAVGAAAGLIYLNSNAYKTKQAVESMQDTVNDWKSQPSETLFSGSGMSYFDLSEDDFRAAENSRKTIEKWKDGLIDVWTDGKKESNEIVSEWTDSFNAFTDATRQELLKLRDSTGGENSFISEDIDEDLAMLDEMDRTIAALLKKRQNGLFTEDDMEVLQDTIEKREAIVVKYSLQEETGKGYDEIIQGINDEVRRAQVEGRGINFSVYEEATLAAAQGYALITKELENQYDVQRRILEAEGNEEKLAQLNLQYYRDKQAAAQEYLNAVSMSAEPILESEDAQKAQGDLETLYGLVEQYQAAVQAEDATLQGTILGQIDELLKNADKDELVELIALTQQLADAGEKAGMSDEWMAKRFGEGYADALPIIKDLMDYLSAVDDPKLESLEELLGGVLIDEARTINVELNRDDLAQQLDDFMNSEDAEITIPAILKPTKMDEAALAAWKENNPIEVDATVRLSNIYADPSEALADETARFFDENGVEIKVEDIKASDLTRGMLVLLTEAEDGKIYRNIIITAVGNFRPGELLDVLEEGQEGFTDVGEMLTGTNFDLSVLKRVESALIRIKEITGDGFFDMLFGYTPKLFQKSLDYDFNSDNIEELGRFIADVYKRLTEGGEVTQEEIDALNTITELLAGLEATGTGTNIITGIQAEMEEAGWTGTADIIDDALKDALDEYVDLRSEGAAAMDEYAAGMLGNKDAPINVAALIGQQVAAAINPFSASTPAGDTQPATVASAASFMGKLGQNMMKSISLGALKAATEQARIIGNAARYISTAAASGILAGGGGGMNTYNQQQTVSVSGNTFMVQSQQDIHQLAYEIAAIMNRRQKGYGG